MAIRQNLELVNKKVKIKPLEKILKIEGYVLKSDSNKEWIEDGRGYTRLIQQEFDIDEIGVIKSYKTYNVDDEIIHNVTVDFNGLSHGWLTLEMLEFLD